MRFFKPKYRIAMRAYPGADGPYFSYFVQKKTFSGWNNVAQFNDVMHAENVVARAKALGYELV